MTARLTGLATIATGGAAFLVLLLYAPALQAPFLVPKFAALEVAAALGAGVFVVHRAKTGQPSWPRPLALGALLVIVTSVVAWVAAASRPPGAPYAVSAMARWGALLGIACGASVVASDRDARRRVLEAVTTAGAVVATIGLLQHLELLPLSIPVISTPGSTFGNRNLAAEVMAMALPLGLGAAAGAPRESRGVMWVCLALELLYLAVTRTRGAWFGAGCGLAAALWMARLRMSRAWRAAVIAAVVMAALAAALPGRFNPRDAGDAKRYSGVVEVLEGGFDARSTALRTRLGLWRRTLSMVRDHPLLGVGPGNWPVFFPRYAEPGALRDGVLSATRAPRQAHNDILERAAETGLIGAAAFGLLAVGAAIAIRRRLRLADPTERIATAAAAGALVALVALSVASFPLEMPATLALAGLALGFVAAATPLSRPPAAMGNASSTPRRTLAQAAAAGAFLLVGCVIVRADWSVRSSWWLGTAERAMREDLGRASAERAFHALNRAAATALDPWRIELRTSQTLLRLGRAGDSARAAEMALAIEPYSPNAWAALAAAQLAAGDHVAARGSASLALHILHDYPAALELRAQAAALDGDLPAADIDRQRLTELASGPASDDTARRARAILEGAR